MYSLSYYSNVFLVIWPIICYVIHYGHTINYVRTVGGEGVKPLMYSHCVLHVQYANRRGWLRMGVSR